MLPPGGDCVWIRPVATKLVSPRSPTDSRSIASPLASSLRRAAMLRASKPAILARPISMRQRDLARPLQPQAGQRGFAEADHAVEIELGRAKLAVDARRPVAGRPRVGQAALDHAAIDLGAQPLDRDAVRPQRHVAAWRATA